MSRRPIGTVFLPARFVLFLLVAPAAFAGLRLAGPARHWADAAALAFDAAALVFLVSLVPLVRGADHVAMRRHSAENDANRGMVLVVTSAITFAVMAVLVGEIGAARGGEPWAIAKLVGTLLLAWLFANAVYTLHYAHLYYRQAGGSDGGGMEFPATKTPDYSDFAYFAFTLGMTFQTSDVAITARPIRRVALAHCFCAFVFNLGVIAFTINALGG